MPEQKQETPRYCDDCVAIKHYDAARAYVDVKLCRQHAATDDLVAAARAALEDLKEYRDSGLIVMDDHDETIAQLESAITKAEKE